MEAQRYAVPELDLSACSPSIVDKINAVPALKTSTGKPLFHPSHLSLGGSSTPKPHACLVGLKLVMPRLRLVRGIHNPDPPRVKNYQKSGHVLVPCSSETMIRGGMAHFPGYPAGSQCLALRYTVF